jgi:hypothetical protein
MKKIQSSLFIFGFLLICLGIYVRINDIHYYWESLCMGILIVLITCIPILIHKIYINKEPKKVLFAIPLFLIIITLASLGIVFLSTLKANKNSTLINMIRANTNLDNEIGEFCYISIAYPSKGTWRRRSRKNVNSNLFLIKGSTKYASNSQFGYCPQNLSRIAKLAG